MPRDLVVGNGILLVNLDRNLNIRDLYYPHVGLYNHLGGYRNRIGVWIDGQFAWLDGTWSAKLGYRPRTLTTNACLANGRLGIGLRFNDTVHPELNLLLRRISVENLHSEEREVRLFFSHDFRIYETDIGDTAFFHPFTGAMVHFKRDCYILTNGRTGDEGIFEYATGVKEFGGAEGTWRDAEDGSLSMHSIEQGSVDSTISFKMRIPGKASAILEYWVAVGRSLEEVEDLNTVASGMSFDMLFSESEDYWSSWLSRGRTPETELPDCVADLYDRSLLVLRTQIDRCGGILAANDTDIMKTARAHYSYVWPRDGALAAYALDLAGHGEPARRFFSFCASILPSEHPFFLQKYCPDGTLGATWHPWIADGEPEIPCQQDSTASVIWAVGKHFDQWRDKDYIQSIFEDLVVPAVEYMLTELDPTTKLPRPSYDLWEQRRGVHLYTCCAVYGALSAATKLTRTFNRERIDIYRQAKDDLKQAILDHFFDEHLGRFIRTLIPTEDGGYTKEQIVDISMCAPFLYELLPADDPLMVSTMDAVYDRLWVRTPIGGLARYEDDFYFQASCDVKNVPGNPWFVSTLWMADWYIAVARSERDLEPAMDLIQWAVKHTSEGGLMAEQIHPFTGEALSVMPLTWSHAAFISTVSKYQSKVSQFTAHKADMT